MIKVAALAFDAYDDIDGSIARNIPSELHSQLKVATSDVVANLHDYQFGLVMKTASGAVLRKLPLHDADAVKLSALYWAQTRESLPDAARAATDEKIAAVAAYLDGDKTKEPKARAVNYVDLGKMKPNTMKKAHVEEHWGLTARGRNYFPLHDAGLIKLAEEKFLHSTQTLDFGQKFAYARAIHARAKTAGVSIPKDSPIHNYTGDEVNTNSLWHGIERRKLAAAAHGLSTEILDQLKVAAGIAEPKGDMETDASYRWRTAKLASAEKLTADQIVAVLVSFDKAAQFTEREYRRGIPDPFATVFAAKAAAFGTSSAMVDGVDLNALDPSELERLFDAAFVEQFRSDPVGTYKTLPQPMKLVVQKLANGGVAPKPQAPACAPSTGAEGNPMDQLNPVFANGTASTY